MVEPPPPPPPGPAQSWVRPHRGAVILVLGILSWVLCFICGICAWVMGNGDLREMDAGRMDDSGRSLTQAGRLLGMIHVIVFLSFVALYLVILAVVGAGALLG